MNEPPLTQIAFLLLCHKNPELVIEQARTLSARGDVVVIHVDGNARAGLARTIDAAIATMPSVIRAPSVRCGWGEWSLVEATLSLIRTAHAHFTEATHFFLISGDCMPVKSASYIHGALADSAQDYIEHADFFEDGWIKTGMTEERLIYRHHFNERTQKRRFYTSLAAQKRFGLRRALPKGLKMKIGSQWWVLRRSTIDRILAFIAKRRDVVRFFKTTWIPDETFFQTLTMHLVAREEVVNKPPTLLMFSDYGMPLSFYADHLEMLRGQWQFAARKISESDHKLRAELNALFLSPDPEQQSEGAGQVIYEYMRKRGRKGKRFGNRIWETGASLGTGFELTLILCKKWHIGNRIAHALSQISGQPTFGYVFDEAQPWLPDLGGLEKGQDKRNRHRRAFLQVLAAHNNVTALTLCIDPANISAIEDFCADGAQVRLLDVRCDMDETWVEGHAARIGLGTAGSNGAMHAGVLRSLMNQIDEEQSELSAMGLPGRQVIHEGQSPGEMARPIAQALKISIDDAAALARREDLFE